MNKKVSIRYIVCFLLTFAYRFFYILGPKVMRVTYDDIGIMCGPASISGCDWSGTMQYIKYYGQSLSVFLTPIFLLFKGNPTAVWYLIEIFYLLVAAFGAMFLYYVGRKYFKIGDSWMYVFFASLSTIAFEPNNDMSNEPALFVASILVAFFLIKTANENSRLRIIIYQIFTLISMMFGYLANSRGMVFWAVIPVMYLWILWKYKGKQLGLWYVWIPGMVAALLGANKVRDWVILKLWNVNLAAGETIINTSVEVSVDKIIQMLSCKSGIKAFLMAVIGGVYGSAIHTYGIILVLLILTALLLFTNKRDKLSIEIEIAALVGVGCFLVGLIGVSTSTLYGEGMWEDIMNNRVSIAYDGLYYYRYYGSFIAPGLFAAMCWIPHCIETSKCRLLWGISGLALMVPIGIFNFRYVVEVAVKYDETREIAMYPYVLKSVYDIPKQFGVCLLIMLLMFLLFISSVWLKKGWLMGINITLLLVLPILFASDRRPYMALLNDHCDTGYYLVHYLENTDMADDLGDTLYLAGETKTLINYQYALMEYKISEDIPEKEDVIVWANNDSTLLDESAGYKWIQLDNNESVYVKGDKYGVHIENFLSQY